ncbi:rRNA maturation RNase YbeY [Aliishimia ponticola]|uniref:Endoribonuclease YbeY n=1 Tax=Aliishimia ponticola TaxID=2499833 RepID=A0A4S4NF00_9RHOB|nr:rRNA maturation RNase YbeY [Aliishimia ponticola]THH37147.1 rRNA maturation RNase YbeY [Aliishimia ponticola]
MTPDIVEEDARWADLGLEALAATAITATLTHLDLDPDAAEIAILACDDDRIAVLNSEFRGKPSPTNVLSWPAQDLVPPEAPEADPDGSLPLGDIALAYDTCAREAAEQGKPMADHVTHLLVHGILHLLGYDHIRDEDATLMEGLEVVVLGKLGLSDPYT